MRAAGLALALMLAAAPAIASPAASGPVVCAGGDTMQGLVRSWAAGLARRAPGVRVRLDADDKLAADGFKRLLAGGANCATFVREPFPSELAAFQARFGYPPTLIPVAGGSFATRGGTHAIAIYVNARNPLRGLGLGQLAAILSANGGQAIRRWGHLGLTGAWADRPIHVYGMLHKRPSGDPPGVVNFVQQRVLHGAALRPDVSEEVDRPGEQALAAIVRKVGADPDGLGYSGFGYGTAGVRALPLSERDGGPFVAGDPASVRERRYPLSRRIYILINRPPGSAIEPPLRAFLAYALSPQGQARIGQDAEGFLPLTPAELVQARRSLR
jgi:phosphate transport system substrate-binding protein